VAEVETTLDPHALLARLLEVERSLGRERRAKWEPRPIDLDLILYGNRVIDTKDLQVPHPLMQERRFVLQPLAELVPDLVHPVSELTIREMLADLDEPAPPPLAEHGIVTRDIACVGCLYNLRGLPVRHQCPECGRPIADTLEPARLEPERYAHPHDKAEQFAAEHGFAPEAVSLVIDAMLDAVADLAEGEHATARQIADAFVEAARARFWDAPAVPAIEGWGIRRSEDVGRIVFAMVRAGWFAPSTGDREEDFNGLFVTSKLFAD
jgi:uncharacterized repeat protein (TIGR04138 family)